MVRGLDFEVDEMQAQTILLATLIAVATLLPQVPVVAAKEVLDANCSLTTGAEMRRAQAYSESFTARHTGKLTRAYIETYNAQNSAATYKLELWAADLSGLPTGTAPLASTTVENPGNGYDFNFAVFSAPAKVRAGHSYALVVTVPDESNNGVTVYPNNPCPGTFSLSSDGSIGAFQPDPEHHDLDFAVWVTVKRHHH
jgi:hypothetical protein